MRVSQRSVLLWGLRQDQPLAAVQGFLEDFGASYVFVNQRNVLSSRIQLSVHSTVEGTLEIGNKFVDLSAISAAYLRPYEAHRLQDIAQAGEASRQWQHASLFSDILWTWADHSPALVVNRPTAMASNRSKPHQSSTIRSVGFGIPETLITTDPEAVLEFRDRHRNIIYKSVSGIRSIVCQFRDEHLSRLSNVTSCPTQFQQHIDGVDYRVHVVGDKVFCSKILSGADDYRYASRQGSSVSVEAAPLPSLWVDKCRELAARLQLLVAGIDLRLTPEGAWYCFEVNPSPAYAYYDQPGQPIARAIAALLMNA